MLYAAYKENFRHIIILKFVSQVFINLGNLLRNLQLALIY